MTSSHSLFPWHTILVVCVILVSATVGAGNEALGAKALIDDEGLRLNIEEQGAESCSTEMTIFHVDGRDIALSVENCEIELPNGVFGAQPKKAVAYWFEAKLVAVWAEFTFPEARKLRSTVRGALGTAKTSQGYHLEDILYELRRNRLSLKIWRGEQSLTSESEGGGDIYIEDLAVLRRISREQGVSEIEVAIEDAREACTDLLLTKKPGRWDWGERSDPWSIAVYNEEHYKTRKPELSFYILRGVYPSSLSAAELAQIEKANEFLDCTYHLHSGATEVD